MVSSVASSGSGSTSILDQAIKNSQNNATSATANSASSTASSVGSSALSSLAGNFNQFLLLLTAQLQHQDPSNPTSTDSFTSELAQFAGVQQQVEANTNLGTLISATQDNELTSASSLIGKTTTAETSTLPLQNGSASLSYTAPQAGDVVIAVTNSSGTVVKTDTVNASAGSNSWAWDGVDNSGKQLADGSYSVAIEGTSTDGTNVSISPVVSGTVTGFTRSASGVQAKMGDTSIDLDDLSGFSST